MHLYRNLLFDLDGTLVDTYEGVSRGVAYTLRALGIPIPAEGELRRYIGPPLRQSFEELAGLSQSDAARAVDIYRSFYRETGIHQCSLYRGIAPMLDRLSAWGYRLAVATSKLESSAVFVLGELGIADRFSLIVGTEASGSRTDKEAVVRRCLGLIPGATPENTLMIGDRCFDVEGARSAAGLQTIGVLWGFGSEEELNGCGAIATVEAPEDLLSLLRHPHRNN